MTYNELEQRVRLLVNDTEPAAYRFQIDIIKEFAAEAVRRLRHLNQSERYGADGLLDDKTPDADWSGDVRIESRHVDAVVMYAAHLVYRLDMSDTVNLQLSETLRARAEALMRT
ncbi:MAG: hypothetical protein II649_11205 [Kiritimatiellae bacterium]|nr:hypothetical protein [Kiritimatiellia bacterium]